MEEEKCPRKNDFMPTENCLNVNPSLCLPLTCSQYVCIDDFYQSFGAFGTDLGKPQKQELLGSSDTGFV